jgi:hypothetical protein
MPAARAGGMLWLTLKTLLGSQQGFRVCRRRGCLGYGLVHHVEGVPTPTNRIDGLPPGPDLRRRLPAGPT